MMNGKYLLIALILLIVQVYCISTSGSRATEQEAVALEIFFKGSCRIVDKILRTMRVSSIGVADTCLPISTTLAGNPDNNDLNVHTLCRDINYGGKPRSLLRLVEIFQGSDDTVPLPAGINYVVSFISDLAFKVNSSDVSYAFRPSCLIERNVCNRSESIVSVCDDRAPNADDDYDRDGYIENGEERVYILQPGQVIRSCNTSATCCPYITTSPTSGICSFHRRPIPGQNRPNKPHRPNHHNNNHYDNDNHHDDHHNDNHHNNHHYNYSKQEEEVKTTTTEQVSEVVAQPEAVVVEKEVVAQPEAVVAEKVETPVVEETN